MTGKKHLHYAITAVLLVCATAIFEAATNIFLPVLPTIQEFFNVGSQKIQWTLSAYLLGFALLGLFAGPLSDHIGRRTMMLVGLMIFWLGSFLSYWFAARSIDALVVSRFIQGLGAGVATGLVLAIIRDLFNTIQAARILSLMGMITALAPMIAPIIGGALADFGNWLNIFLIMFLMSTLLLFLFSLYGVESISSKRHFHAKHIISDCCALIKNKECTSFILISSLIYGSLFAWIVQAPFYFEVIFHLSDFSYALYAALGPIMYIMGSLVNYMLLPRVGILMLLRFGLGLSLFGCLALLCATLHHTPHLWLYMGAFLIFNAGIAFVFANASAKAVDLARDKRGTASALLISCEQLFAAFSSYIVGIHGPLTLTPAILVMLFSVIGAVLIYKHNGI